MKKTKVAIIGTVGLPANYGGFETMVSHITSELNEKLDISVYCSAKAYAPAERIKSFNGCRLIYLPMKANGPQSIIYDSVSMLHAVFYAEVLLVLGVAGGFLIPFLRLFTSRKIICSIDGIEWKRNKWNKWVRWYLWASEWLAVKFAHANIADNESIQDYTAIRYKLRSDIIEYGADHANVVKPLAADIKKYPFLARPYAVKVCRIEPENNIHVVLEAFSKLPQHTLVLIGNWNKSEYGIGLKEQYKHYNNITLLDPVYEQRTIDLLRSNAIVYIHGHSAGGTNPSLVEAMSLGLPVIAYNVSYNRTTTEQQALYFRNADELVSIISRQSIKTLKAQAVLMKYIADRRYTWKVIADKYHYLIRLVSGRQPRRTLVPTVAKSVNNSNLIAHGIAHLQSPLFFYEKKH